MGLLLSKREIKRTPTVVLMGLGSSGKSTLLFRFKTGLVMDTSPTVGFNVVTLDLNKKMALTVWDVGRQGEMRANWRHYLEGCKAMVFVVDSSDRASIGDSQKALKNVLSDDNMKGIPLMVLANKKDLPNTMNIREVSNQLELPSYKDRAWQIQACSGLKGMGLQQAFLSVAKLIKKS
ncbi:ADP-ribosylation factor-like protein 11 [Oncorhynchus mykiss]|uniref:ADP-ribosylation factor-like protein 14 n=1 Tax=Oncorhynchus mykiss TaxID=8022 RepID=A0A8C7P3L8_ONCMY|nr:ADP-ribosylation factor-like protein 11 [Oncorhynchus mykiss]